MVKQWKQWQTLFSWSPKSLQMVAAATKIQRHLLLGRKTMTNLDSILKRRDITLPTKVCIIKAVVFKLFMYGCESWTIKKAEHEIIDAFELWCWRRFLSVPWIARRSNQSILKEINSEYFIGKTDAEAKATIIWLPDAKSQLFRKDPDAGKYWMQEKKGTEEEIVGWHHWLSGHEFEQALGDGERQGSLACCSPWGSQSQTGLSDWTSQQFC